MASHVMAVFNTVENRIEQIVIDAENYQDPSFNPPDCVQIHLDPALFQNCQSPEEVLQMVMERVG
jgi:hypothetical protein